VVQADLALLLSKKLAKHGMSVAVLTGKFCADKLLKEKFKEIAISNSVTILPFNINAVDHGGIELFIKEFTGQAINERCEITAP